MKEVRSWLICGLFCSRRRGIGDKRLGLSGFWRIIETPTYFNWCATPEGVGIFLDKVSIDGALCAKPTQVKEGVFDFFKDHFAIKCLDRSRMEGIEFARISTDNRKHFEVEFSVEEVKDPLNSCDGNNVLGSDGFNMNFIMTRWKDIEGDFMSFMNVFYLNGSKVSSLNHCFLTFIPKLVNPSSFNDYRPISLVKSIYMVLVKVLPNRLRKVMNGVIGESQMAFVENNQIIDSFVVANKIISSWKREKEGGLF
ncbi:hypothetical protein Dsin_020630 [Dipteronia sinensis]|uniref:Reverse transcriptase domain-containing protein n=1 Tax=Dipteronia sinensis TaxID=43782 RepID=A0AAE0AAD9_9ROSI|nr:hypothetical protein Dsin_020630 [Dipteronia sinensis]